VDVAVERRLPLARRGAFPDHQILAEEMGGPWRCRPVRAGSSIRSTHANFAHGLPIFCASLALEIDGVPEVAAVYDPNRQGAVHGGAGRRARFLNGRPLHVSSATELVDAMLVTDFRTTSTRASRRSSGCSARFVGQARAVRRLGRPPSSLLCRRRAARRLWETISSRGTSPAARSSFRGRRTRDETRTGIRSRRARARAGHERTPPRRDAVGHPTFRAGRAPKVTQ